MSELKPVVDLARITLEATAPLSLACGRSSAPFEVRFVSDANGLPAIPGAALAGVLRSALGSWWCECLGRLLRSRGIERADAPARLAERRLRRLFGHADGDQGAASALAVTWAHIHDSRDTPVDGLDTARHWSRDALLSVFIGRDPPGRGHFRLSPRGTALYHGQHGRGFVPAGHRFTFEMALWHSGEGKVAEEWAVLRNLLATPEFRLGGGTRRGYGALRVLRFAEARFDLRKADEFRAYARHPRRLDVPAESLREVALPTEPDPGRWLDLELEVHGEDFWRFGGGDLSLTDALLPADQLPYTEERVVWVGGRGHRGKRRVVIPASAVKGALAHRTAYHFNRLSGRFAGRGDPAAMEQNPAVRQLFGFVEAGHRRAGGILIDDVAIADPAVSRLTHTSLDRFTGGVREGVLFSEEAVVGQSFRLTIRLDRVVWRETPGAMRAAFQAATQDLIQGRLALGAGGAKGFGYFEGRILRDELGETGI